MTLLLQYCICILTVDPPYILAFRKITNKSPIVTHLVLKDKGINQLNKYLVINKACLAVTVNFAVIVADELLDKLAILV